MPRAAYQARGESWVIGAGHTGCMSHVGRRLNPADERLGRLVRDVRVALGWSQRALGRRVGRSQAWLSRAERGLVPDMSAARAERILAVMGARLIMEVEAPHLADRRRQREPAHSQTSGPVAMRLRKCGWLAETEVEIGDGRRRGWIRVLAWHPLTGLLLVIEVKTDIHDLGAIQRTLASYERGAWTAARRFGWRPRATHGSLLAPVDRGQRPRGDRERRGAQRRLPAGSDGSWLDHRDGPRSDARPIGGGGGSSFAAIGVGPAPAPSRSAQRGTLRGLRGLHSWVEGTVTRATHALRPIVRR